MARIVLVHGIAQQQRSADDLEHEWLPSLAGGVRNARHPDLADQLWPIHHTDRPARMAFYGNLFLTPDQQGHTIGLTDAQSEVADEIALDWLTNALDSTRIRDAGTARQELDAMHHDPTDAQGLPGTTARALAALDRIPWFGNAGFHLAGRHALLGQAVRYLTEPDIRKAAIAAVRAHLDDDTRVVLAHSLGSVVAYEALRNRSQPLPLLITIGSPLGLPSVIRHLQQPPTYPGGRLVFHVFAALAEFMRELIVAGTREGLAAARARGRVGGRPSVATPELIRAARDMLPNLDASVTSIARLLGVSVGTLYNHIPDLRELRASRVREIEGTVTTASA